MSPSAKMKPPVGANDHVQGTANAPVTLVEYGDYECPYCGEAYPIVKALQERLGKQMRFVFRNFPLSEMHPHAEHAAEAAEAAGGQGKFWEMHDLLYENQDALEDEDLARYAKALKLDMPRQVFILERILILVEQIVHLPELALPARRLGRFGRMFGMRMHLA